MYKWVALLVRNPPANSGDVGSIPGSEASPGGGCGNPLQLLLPREPHVMSPNGHHQMLADTSIVISYPFFVVMRNFKIGSPSNSSVCNSLIIRFDQHAVREFTLFYVLSSILTHRLCLHDTKSHVCLYY